MNWFITTRSRGDVNVEEKSSQSSFDSDRELLARLGKKQVLKRNFGFLSLFSFSCTILVTWETVLPLFTPGFVNGGPAGLAYGFLIAWCGSLSTYTVIGELASIAPTAGGQYYWVYMLAPEPSKKFLSYMIGWITTIAWIATVAAQGYIGGTMIQGLIVLNHQNYAFKPLHGTLLSWASVLVAALINSVIRGALPLIETLILVIHVLGFFGILIPFVHMAPHSSASDVFTTVLNEGKWPTQSLSFCVGLVGSIADFVGADAAVHMSEEIHNASLNVPRAIFTSVLINGAFGFAMLLALLFCLGNIEDALKSPTKYPFIEILTQATNSVPGTTAMVSIIIVMSSCATIGFVATSSRMAWSFARDRGLPFSKLFSKLTAQTTPLASIVLVTALPNLLLTLNIASPTLFNDVISLTVSSFYLSYLIPCSLLLYRRCSGGITAPTASQEPAIAINFTPSPSSTPSPDTPKSSPRAPLIFGPWHLRGIWGIFNNALACSWQLFAIFWSFWPPDRATTARTMNWSAVVTGGVAVWAGVYYAGWGRRGFKGPVREVGGKEGEGVKEDEARSAADGVRA